MWLRADRQTAGRGRQGRGWESPAGNFHGSTLVSLRPTDPPAHGLSLVAGVALHQTVSAYLPPEKHAGLRLKWPNDLLLGGAKLAGILLERMGDAVVIGIGVNLAAAPDVDRAAASLDGTVSPADFGVTLAEAVARWLDRWRAGGFERVRTDWLARAHPVGAPLRVHAAGGEPVEGLFDGLSGDGALILRLADGRAHVIHAGDVFLI